MTTLSVCIGTSCHLKGSYNVIQAFQQKLEELKLYDRVEMKAAFCCKNCHKDGVSVLINGKVYGVKPETADDFFEKEVLPLVK